MTIPCPFYSRAPGNTHNGQCALGWSSGRPFAGECLKCIAAGRNTPEAYAAAQAAHEKQFPESARNNVRPCC